MKDRFPVDDVQKEGGWCRYEDWKFQKEWRESIDRYNAIWTQMTVKLDGAMYHHKNYDGTTEIKEC